MGGEMADMWPVSLDSWSSDNALCKPLIKKKKTGQLHSLTLPSSPTAYEFKWAWYSGHLFVCVLRLEPPSLFWEFLPATRM